MCRTKANRKIRVELIAIATTDPEQLIKVDQLVQRNTVFLTELWREVQNPNQPPDMIELIDRLQQ